MFTHFLFFSFTVLKMAKTLNSDGALLNKMEVSLRTVFQLNYIFKLPFSSARWSSPQPQKIKSLKKTSSSIRTFHTKIQNIYFVKGILGAIWWKDRNSYFCHYREVVRTSCFLWNPPRAADGSILFSLLVMRCLNFIFLFLLVVQLSNHL
mgnify:CR=1 FL=1